MKPTVFAWTTILFFVLSSCTPAPTSPKDLAFLELFPSIKMNKDLKLEFWQTTKYPLETSVGTVDFFLEFTSQRTIRFPPNMNSQIYTFSELDQKWIEIDDRSTYLGESLELSRRSIPYIDVSVEPDIPVEELPVTIRVVVMGEIIRNGKPTGEMVGAYTDVILDDTAPK